MSNVKKEIFSQIARVAKALGSGNRLEIIDFLAQSERGVDALAKLSDLSIANTSHHLQQLKQAGLVTSRKEGQQVFYSLSGEGVVALCESLRGVAEQHLAEVDKLVNTFLTSKDALEPILRNELLQRVREGSVLVLDVRPAEEYLAGHVAGAINLPLSELENHLDELDSNQEVVAYCRGPHCVLAYEAVEKLREKGFKARRMQDGMPEWRLAGLPVE